MSEVQVQGLGELAKAYTAAYAEITNAVKNAKNPHLGNTYADLGAVLAAVRPVFARHGLAVYQAPGKLVEVAGGLAVSVVSILMHSGGQLLPVETQLPVAPQFDKKTGQSKVTAQTAGSAITYARRYALAAICGITQQDDDGEQASVIEAAPPTAGDLAALGAEVVATSTIDALNALRARVSAAGDKDLADVFVKHMRGLKAGGSK